MRIVTNGTDRGGSGERTGAFDLYLLAISTCPGWTGSRSSLAFAKESGLTRGHLPVIALTGSRQDQGPRLVPRRRDGRLPLAEAHSRRRPLVGHSQKSRRRRPPAAATCPRSTPVPLLEACGEDAVSPRKLCRALEAHLPREPSRVQQAITRLESRRGAEAAHRLAGMLSALPSTGGPA